MSACLLGNVDRSPARSRVLCTGLAIKFSLVSKSRRVVRLLCLIFCITHQANIVAANETGRALTGSDIFLKYCAGCHGFDGFAKYEHAPSFSMGERLHKNDQELLRSVIDGRHAMPYWEYKLTRDMLRSAIAYIRIMDQRYRSGLPPREEPIPETHYRFNPVGEGEGYWLNRD